MISPRPFAPRTHRAVGRTEEIKAVEEALADEGGQTDLLYFTGPGGIGKTRLLEEAARLADPPVQAAPLIDLYHANFHSVTGLEKAIVQGLDPEGLYFLEYRRRRANLETRRAEGVKIPQKEQQALTVIFVGEYNALAQLGRPLLRFDTTELIQRESDRVQELCDLETEYIEVRHWLLNVLPQLQNSVILLAGRPPAPLLEPLRERWESLEHASFHAFELGGLAQEAYREYLDTLVDREPRLAEIPEDVWQRAWDYTAGHPIRLSLMIDLVLHGRDIAQLFPPQDGPESPTYSHEEIDRYLIEELLRLPQPILDLLYYLALARKGLDVGLLHHLEPNWSEVECRARLAEMQEFTFVKVHAGTDKVFAHDELYALFDRFVLRERQEFAGTYRRICEYYEELAEEPRQAESLKTDRLYYQLQADPWTGFWSFYVLGAEEAVRAGNTDLDMRLRDELLHFLHDTRDDPWVSIWLPPEVVDADAAVRWMRRYLSRPDYQRAIELAQRVKESEILAQSPLHEAGADIAHAEAVLYSSAEEEAWILQRLTDAAKTLRAWEPETQDDVRLWWRARLQGRAHNDLGYFYWQEGQNQDAITEYRRAIWAYRRAKINDEMAATLTNLGFVYTQLGLNVEAETTLLDAVELRRGGPALPLSYSLNTLGLFYIFADRLEQGIRRCKESLEIFKRLKQPRGEGLAHLALGLGYRKMGEEWKQGLRLPEEATENFVTGLEHLENARAIFETRVDEPLRLWEAYNELGSLHLDWGYMLQQKGEPQQAEEKYEQAIEYLKRSVEIAQKHSLTHQMVDSYDDLSQVYADMGIVDKAGYYVSRIEDIIPQDYRLILDGSQNIRHPVGEEWWLLLGKLHLGKAVRHIKQAVDSVENGDRQLESELKDSLLDKAAQDYAYAVAYFQKYSPHSAHLGRTLRSIQRRVRKLRADRIERMYERIEEFQVEHNVELDRLLRLLKNTLGIERW